MKNPLSGAGRSECTGLVGITRQRERRTESPLPGARGGEPSPPQLNSFGASLISELHNGSSPRGLSDSVGLAGQVGGTMCVPKHTVCINSYLCISRTLTRAHRRGLPRLSVQTAFVHCRGTKFSREGNAHRAPRSSRFLPPTVFNAIKYVITRGDSCF